MTTHLCENCQTALLPKPEPEPEKKEENNDEKRSRGRPLVFKTPQERTARKSEYNKRYYNKLKMRLKNEIEKENT
jgi:hypothetical protein